MVVDQSILSCYICSKYLHRCTANGVAGFMIIDLKRVMNVEGVQTQGRVNGAQWVSGAEIAYSLDGQRWDNQGRYPLK